MDNGNISGRKFRYITQEVIDAGYLNITSTDMFNELREFNILMQDMRMLKLRFYLEYSVVVLLNLIVLPLGLLLLAAPGELRSGWIMGPMRKLALQDEMSAYAVSAVFVLAYLFCFVFFVVHKKDYSPKKCLLYTLFLIPVNLIYIIVYICNFSLMYFFNALDRRLKNEMGYPHFIRIADRYPQPEKEEEEEHEISFDDYKSDVNDMETL